MAARFRRADHAVAAAKPGPRHQALARVAGDPGFLASQLPGDTQVPPPGSTPGG